MRSSARLAGVLGLTIALGAGPVFGSGYSIYEQGAEAMANAGAFTARADDASAMFFNPAGLLGLEGKRLYVGTHAIFLTGSEFEDAGTGQEYDQSDNIAWPSVGFFTHKVSDRLAYGLGFTSPFGLKTEWDQNFSGRFISRESNLAVVNFNANLAFKLGNNWAGAVGLDYARADVREISRNLDLSPLLMAPVEGFSKLTGDGTDIGWNAAVRWAGESGWRWGLSYRAEMTPEVEGTIEFEGIPAPIAALFPDGPGTADIPLPATAATGVALVKDKWEAEFDIVWTGWSAFDRLQVDLENNTVVANPMPPPATVPVVDDLDQIEEWDDTYSFRAGFSYHVNDHHEWRAGAYYDQNPIPDEHVRPRLPDADRTSAQVGYGYRGANGFSLDVAYQALFFKDRTATGNPNDPNDPVQPGEYSNFTSLLGVSAGWKF